MFRFRSIRTRTLSIMLPVIIVTLLIVMALSYWFSILLLNEEMTNKMNVQLDLISSRVEGQLDSHSKITDGLARIVEISPSSYSIDQFNALLAKTVPLNDTTLGMGVFTLSFPRHITMKR
jgi:methyl-accepting chemotaxis protein